jgi:AraC family transcriptional regulator, exoenzyme S synthesis regulatory protein ExsA
MENSTINKAAGVLYSCYTRMSREGENFIPEHIFTYIESGSLAINDGRKEYLLKAGDFAFYVKNRLAKFSKLPDADSGEYKGLSIRLDAATLAKIKDDFKAVAQSPRHIDSVVVLEPEPLYLSFVQSLIAYLNSAGEVSETIIALKVQEIALLLAQNRADLVPVLFDFSEPGKIGLKDFMMRNFNFNVPLERFAYLTGRSLSTFKRDFVTIFNTTPSRWLQQKRLEEAHFLIAEKGKKASDVYIEVGFENLSHFSFAFKKAFGVAPSQLG